MPPPALTEDVLRDRAWQYQDRLFLPAELISLAPFTTFALVSLLMIILANEHGDYTPYVSLAVFIDAVNYLLAKAIPLRKPRIFNIDQMADDARNPDWMGIAFVAAAQAITTTPVAAARGARGRRYLVSTIPDSWALGIVAVLLATYLARLGYYFYEDILPGLLTRTQVIEGMAGLEGLFPFTRIVRLEMFHYETGFATFKEFLVQMNMIGLLLLMELGFLLPLLRGYLAGGYGPAGLARAIKLPADDDLPDRDVIRGKLRMRTTGSIIVYAGLPSFFALLIYVGAGITRPLHSPFDRYHVIFLPPAFVGILLATVLFSLTFRISLRRNTLRYLKANGLLATAP